MGTPWASFVRQNTLIVAFPEPYRIVSWAPLGGGLVEARTILNHQVNIHETSIPEPDVFMRNLALRLDVEFPVVGLMTGVLMQRLVRNIIVDGDLIIECFATVGLSNALAVGDLATYGERPGTINLIIAINRPLAIPAMMEAIQIMTEAKVAALFTAQIRSTVSPAFATGTGTDCVAIACPPIGPTYHFCGKHTKLGELIGQVTTDAVGAGIRKATTS